MKLLILFVFGMALAAPTIQRLKTAEVPFPCYPQACPSDQSK